MIKLEKLLFLGLLGFPFLVAIWYASNKGYIYSLYGYVALGLMVIIALSAAIVMLIPSKKE